MAALHSRSRLFMLHLLLLFSSSAEAALHHLFVGGFRNDALYALEFDDEKLSLKSAKASTAQGGHSWIAFDYAKKNLYGVAGSKVSSYSVLSPSTLRYDRSVPLCPTCTETNIYVMASEQPPYTVYSSTFGSGTPYAGVMQVTANGTLDSMLQLVQYSTTAGVHGLAMSPDHRYMYSADDTGNAVWTHAVQPNGTLTYVGKLSGPSAKSDPRHAAVHPTGQYLYVVLEGSNQLAVYQIDPSTRLPTLVNPLYPLLPTGQTNANWWADEVVLSSTSKYLWATTRARTTSAKGYISAFALSTTGAVTSQLFLTPTTNSGGSANAVTPAPFSDQWVALTDSSTGFVEIWQLAADGSSAKAVAHVDIKDNGCCANAIWYD